MKKLKWDSDFWGVDVIHVDNLKYINLDDFSKEKVLMQALVDCDEIRVIKKLEESGFRFKEVKVTLQKKKNCK